MTTSNEDDLLKAVALRNASTVLKMRRQAEEDLVQAKLALEHKTEELALSLAMMKATLDSATDAILVTDESDRVTAFNEKFTRMWPMPAEMLQSAILPRVSESMSRHFQDPAGFIASVLASRAAPADTFDTLERMDGCILERQSRPQVLDGRVVGRVWNYRDVTEQRRAALDNARLYEAAQEAAAERERLLVSERSARNLAERISVQKDDFLATLSHELRTPLSAILGWVHIMRRGMDRPADLLKGLDTIERNSRMQAQLIDDLLDMNRIAAGKVRLDIQPVDPISFIEAALEAVRPAADAKQIRIQRLLDPSVGPLPGDPARLQQVVANLLSNAVKFTPSGGSVQVILARVNSLVEVTVADTGIGIRPEFLADVFERFRQADSSTSRQYGGLGLGLSITRSLVELHGGSVDAKSEGEGKGAVFTVRLPVPLVQEYAAGIERVHPRGLVEVAMPFVPIDLSGLKILVVDDDADGCELARRIFEDCHAQVFVARDAAQALALVEAQRPELMVSDIGMPQVDGYELLRRVRALGEDRGGGLAAIALTAFARSQDRVQALHAGFAAHLSKPVQPSELLATAASATGRVGQKKPLAA